MGNNTSSLLNLVKGHNITNIKNFGAVFKDTLDIEFIKDKETQLEKQLAPSSSTRARRMPEIPCRRPAKAATPWPGKPDSP